MKNLYLHLKTSVVVLTALFFSGQLLATTCPNAVVVNSLPYSAAVVCNGTNDITSTNASVCSPVTSSYYGGQEALLTYTPTSTGPVNIAYSGQTWTSIVVYAGCPTSGGTCVNGVSSSASSKSLTVTLTAGVQYYILIDTYPTPDSPCPGTVTISLPPPPPANDNCTGAIDFPAIPTNGSCATVTVNTANATGAADAVCFGTEDDDVWYRFTTPAGITSVLYSNTNISGSSDRMIQIYSGASCGALTSIGCYDPESGTITGLTGNTTYYLRTYTYSSGVTSNFSICLSIIPPPPANDNCSGALPIACGATVSGTTTGATFDNVGTCGTSNTAPGVWYSFTSPANGDATVSLCGSSYDTKISVFSGSCASLTCVGGNDDFCSLQSQLTFSATAGTTYYVLVHGFSSATGAFSLSLTCPVDPCANDMVAPSITCPGTQTANLGANCTFTLPSYTGLATGVTDNCTTPTVTQSPAIGASVSGNTTITLRATDGAGNSNSCTFSLNVSDVTAPSISCPGTITPAVLSPTNCTNALPDYRPFVNASDNCGAPTLSQTPVQGTIISGVQTVTVTVRATDAAGNSNSCTYMVPHVDVTPPTAVCRTTTVFLPPSGVYTLQNADVFNAMASSDNCGGVSVYSISPSMVDVNDAGTTVPVMVLVQDASGNVAGCTANISVEAGAALPEPWECSGINNASTSCSYNPVDDSFTIQTGGANNNLGTDNLGFINLDLCGDFELTVKIESITPNGYAGLLARESDAVGSKMVGMYSNFTNMVRWEARTLTNGNKAVNFFGKPAPYWLKLKRQGNMFFGYYSYNGASFSIVTAQMVPMSSCLDIGMAAFTNIPGTTAIAVFSNLSISGANPTIVELPTTEVEQAGVSRNITLFPNPAQDVVTLSFSELQFGEAGNTSSKLEFGGTVRLRNELGQLIETRQLEPGTERLDWNVSSLNPGLYFIEVQTEGEAPQTLRFVKAK